MRIIITHFFLSLAFIFLIYFIHHFYPFIPEEYPLSIGFIAQAIILISLRWRLKKRLSFLLCLIFSWSVFVTWFIITITIDILNNNGQPDTPEFILLLPSLVICLFFLGFSSLLFPNTPLELFKELYSLLFTPEHHKQNNVQK